MLVWADGFDDRIPVAAKYGLNGAGGVTLNTASGRVTGTDVQITGQAAVNHGYLQRILGATYTTLIQGFGVFVVTPTAARYPLCAFNEGNALHVTIDVDSTGAIYACRSATTLGNGVSSTILGQTAAGVIAANTWYFIEVKATISDTVGAVEVRVNGTVVLTLTGLDTRNGGTGVIDNVTLHGFWNNPQPHYDDWYVVSTTGGIDTTYLGDVVVEAKLPSAQGFHADGHGSDGDSINNYQLVAEVTPSTADYVDLRATGDADTYAFFDTAASTVLGVVVTAYIEKTDAGARSSQQIARIGGTDYNVGSAAALSAGTFTAQSTVLDASPATAVAWTAAEVNGAELGVKAA